MTYVSLAISGHQARSLWNSIPTYSYVWKDEKLPAGVIAVFSKLRTTLHLNPGKSNDGGSSLLASPSLSPVTTLVFV